MLTRLSFCALLFALFGAAGAHYYVLSPPLGFWIWAASLAVMALGLPLGLLAWMIGRKAPWVLLGLGAVACGALVYTAGLAMQNPLPDLSTDAKDAPAFETPLSLLDVRGPDGKPDPAFLIARNYAPAAAAEQKRLYPGLGSVLVQAPQEATFTALAQSIKALPSPCKFATEDPAKFHLETSVESSLFRFVDDIVIELRPEGRLTRVDFRSRARWPVHGFGAFSGRTSDFGSGVNRITYLRSLVPLIVAPVEAAAKKGPAPALPKSLPNAQATAAPANPAPVAMPTTAAPAKAAPLATPVAPAPAPLPTSAPVPPASPPVKPAAPSPAPVAVPGGKKP